MVPSVAPGSMKGILFDNRFRRNSMSFSASGKGLRGCFRCSQTIPRIKRCWKPTADTCRRSSPCPARRRTSSLVNRCRRASCCIRRNIKPFSKKGRLGFNSVSRFSLPSNQIYLWPHLPPFFAQTPSRFEHPISLNCRIVLSGSPGHAPPFLTNFKYSFACSHALSVSSVCR